MIAWRTALEAEGLDLATPRIHRRVGMDGTPFAKPDPDLFLAAADSARA